MIFDSDVVIWALRGNLNARNKIIQNAPLRITAISYMEVIQGMKNKNELLIFKNLMKNLNATLLYPSEDSTKNAVSYVENYFLSNSMEMPDAMIASICIKNDEVLCTANDKHYKVIPNLKLEIFRP